MAEDVERVNPDLVVRDTEGKVNTVRYEAVKMSKKRTAFRKMREARWQWHLLNVSVSTILIFSLIILLFGVDVNSRHEAH